MQIVINILCNCASGRGAEHCVVHAGNHVLPALDSVHAEHTPYFDTDEAAAYRAYDDGDMA